MRELTTKEVAEITGIPRTTLVGWVDAAVLVPVGGGGKGRGNDYRFTLMQTVGLVVADAVRQGPQGCVTSYIGEIVTAFKNLSEAELLKRIERDGRAFVLTHNDKPILQGRDYPHWPDVLDAYHKVVDGVERINQELISGERR